MRVFNNVMTRSIITAACAASLNACEKKKDEDTVSTTSTTKTGTLSLGFVRSETSQASLSDAMNLLRIDEDAGMGLTSGFTAGQASLSDLKSLKYRLSSIILCEKLVTKGTASECQGNQFSIYSEPVEATSDYNTFLPEQAEADTTNFTDFMSKESMAALGKNVEYGSNHVGKYTAALVYWYRPFKVKSSITLSNGSKLYTKAKTSYTKVGENLDTRYVTKITGSTSPEAEEGVFFLPNGGTYFRLQKPFEITADDYNNNVEYKIAMAFDPDGLIKGYTEATAPWSAMWDETAGYTIYAPFLRIAPVAAKKSETIMREIYLLDYVSGGAANTPHHSVRLNLYYIKDDSAKAIRAANSVTLYNVNSSGTVVDFGAIDSVTENANGTIDLKDWMGLSVIGGLERHTATGSVGTVTSQSCSGSITDAGCSGTTVTATYNYTLVGIGEVDAVFSAKAVPTPTPAPTASPTTAP